MNRREMPRDPARDQRRMQRVRSKGTVQVGDGTRWAEGRIDDLSASGIRVEVGRDWPIGAVVFLDVCFDAAPSQHFLLTGCVRRSSGYTFAVELDEIPTSFEAVIIDELIAEVERQTEPRRRTSCAHRTRRLDRTHTTGDADPADSQSLRD